MANEESVAGRLWLRTGSRGAVRFIILLGVVSLFADATYESARSILGPFLASLGATGLTVGLIAGFGESLNNGLRVFFGYFADHTGRYWAITIIGFAINMASVPLLAFAGSLSFAKTSSSFSFNSLGKPDITC